MSLKQVLRRFDSGYNCCQAILLVFGERYGLTQEHATRLGTPFVAGMGYTGHTCGALVAAMMVLGLAFGRVDAADQATEKRVAKRVRTLLGEFETRHGASACRDLRAAHRKRVEKTPEGQPFMAAHCRSCVHDAVEILQDLLVRESG
jgi:C_GCAxxG_C_C family probable redox protein